MSNRTREGYERFVNGQQMWQPPDKCWVTQPERTRGRKQRHPTPTSTRQPPGNRLASLLSVANIPLVKKWSKTVGHVFEAAIIAAK